MICAIRGCSRTAQHGTFLCAGCLLAPVVLVTAPGRETATLWLHPACAGRVAESGRWKRMLFEAMADLEAAGPECAVCHQEIAGQAGGRRAPAQERLW